MGSLLTPPGQPKPLAAGDFTGAGQSSVVSFAFQGIGPPSAIYIQRDDVLVVEATMSNQVGAFDTIQVQARLLLATPPLGGQPDGSGAGNAVLTKGAYIDNVVQTFKVSAPSTPTLLTINLGEGYLLSLSVVSTNATSRGQTFARAWINRGVVSGTTPTASYLLLQDYITNFAPASWPSGRTTFPTEGPGFIYSQQVANPGAGADWTLAVPTGRRWRLQSWNAQLLTSGSAGNRVPRAIVQDTALHTVWRAALQQNIPASTTAQVSASSSQTTSTLDATTCNLTLPSQLMLPPGFVVGVSTAGILAGDQWSAIWVVVEEWLDNL